ncbi:MAG TPA: DUF349 domain-containing protein [Cyclobacteriaceae bacterium]|nr:DUF349 domain-containing protein [Cyclobacteriaceae bacterium]HMV11046.1 DUF349 domain-containing protein [Cyclobacteriaceae bacterium]HMV90297.1 DUF349 domain-containing protein [Cyclobacteriaceae bacterium]HMX02733.1 DUF349 domain-containing protein [Cyclobacteriaceae bacterium]HMX51814.1 DUF349 domain-containing protein [Cyclobacteriaceae bacterium]
MELENEKDERDSALNGASHANPVVLNSEADLSDREQAEHAEEELEHIDYSTFTKSQFVDHLKELAKNGNQRKLDQAVREIKPLFDDLKERERTAALNRFILDGGSPDDFEYRGDEHTLQFESLLKQVRDRKVQLQKSQEDQRNENLRKKTELLEKLRDLVDSSDPSNQQFNQFKEFQKEWKNTGAVPVAQSKTLWANYHALVDRFYDNQSIYFELKELDRKKNLESKLELCSKAEKLKDVEKVRDAIKELNDLHHEFKHIGPVPMEEKEGVWQRFKAASDAVYAKRDEYLKTLQQELAANFEQKSKLSDEVTPYSAFQSDRIKEWNAKTKEVLELQKKWDAIGGLPRAKSKEVNKKFWSAFKTFFSNKSAFFKKLDEERGANLKKKNELVQRALELKESSEWDKAANELKNLQQQWREIGPVPEKFREKVYKEFKEACDFFFEQKRNQHGKVEHEQVENLKAKEAVCAELEKHIAENTATPALLKELEVRFNQIGFVPKKDMAAIRKRYHEAAQKFTGSIQGITEDEKNQLLLENELADLKNDPMSGQKIFQKEQAIRKKITKVENDISTLRNNLEFFGRSKNADKYKEEFNAKIREADENLKQLKQQLKLLRTVS